MMAKKNLGKLDFSIYVYNPTNILEKIVTHSRSDAGSFDEWIMYNFDEVANTHFNYVHYALRVNHDF